jgi:serine/threonine protein kinase/tetratricopeptide (TPR) repeat protein
MKRAVEPSLGRRDPVEELAEAFLERHRRGERPAIEEFIAQAPEYADEIRELFPALILLEEAVPDEQEAPVGPLPANHLDRIGDYRIIREVGRGGMGIVYEAEQEALRRHVALKILPPNVAADSQSVLRFQREARSAARLHHTNIVPVFDVGEREGVHYYAMQFILGQSLNEIIRELRPWPGKAPTEQAGTSTVPPRLAADLAGSMITGRFQAADPAVVASPPADSAPSPASASAATPASAESSAEKAPSAVSLFDRSDLGSRSHAHFYRNVARVGQQAASALAYAHRQRVLHRDIKPANLLLDVTGTVWVTDFGLAKEEGDDLTHTGDVVGTLRYIAPERFSRRADPRSDVYSLGLTLYELLTLKPAFPESDRVRLVHAIAHRDPEAPRRLDPRIPRDLETIVLKAITKEPGGRYARAEDLQDDLSRFLLDQPIQARRASGWERTWRWCRRNPFLASVSVAACLFLVTAIVAVTAGIVSAERAKNRIQQAFDAEAIASQRARQALDAMFSQVVQDWLASRSRLEPEQKEFLEKALSYYQAFAAESGDHQDIRQGVASALKRSGQIRDLMGQHEEALSAYSKARDRYEALCGDYPEVSDYRLGLAETHQVRGGLLSRLGRLREAEEAERISIDLLQKQTADLPTAPNLEHLARSQAVLGTVLKNAGQAKAAESAYLDALATQKQLVAKFPAEPTHQFGLANTYNDLAIVLALTGRVEGAEQAFRESIAVLKQLTITFPAMAAYRHQLAVQHFNMGKLFLTINPKIAETELLAAITIEKQLAADFPSVPVYRSGLANSQHNLALICSRTGRLREAEAAYRDTAAVRRQLAADYPSMPAYQEDAANDINGLALFLMDHGHPKEAESAFRESLALREELARRDPANTDYRAMVTQPKALLATLWAANGDYARAIAQVDAVDTNPHITAQAYYDMACACSLASAAVTKDAKLSATNRMAFSEDYAARAVALLGKAKAGHFRNIGQEMKTDSDFKPIRSRQDFQKLLRESEPSKKPNS